jgi:hypothetical protein
MVMELFAQTTITLRPNVTSGKDTHNLPHIKLDLNYGTDPDFATQLSWTNGGTAFTEEETYIFF